VDYAADTIYWAQYVNISVSGTATNFLILFSSTGKVFAYNIDTNTSTTIKTGFSGSGSRCAQYKNLAVLFIDSTGYYSWDGTTFSAALSGTGVPGSGSEIAVYAGRVWIVQKRTIAFSGADDGSAAPWITLSASSAWTPANGSGFVQMTDPTIKGDITRLWVQNGYLYIFSQSSINIISDVYVPTGASPPVPVFSNLNINANIGTDQPGSVFSFGRAIAFASSYGAYQMYGVADEKLSTVIDGTWGEYDNTLAISGGSVAVNNIVCAGFLFKQYADEWVAARTVIAMYFDKKWWFANYGALTFITNAVKTGAPIMFGFIGNKMYQLFAAITAGQITSSPPTLAMTPLWAMEDPIAKKRVIRVGFQYSVEVAAGSTALTVDTTNTSVQVTGSSSLQATSWINNSSSITQWQNNALAIVTWFSSNQTLLWSGSPPGSFDNFVGMTLTTQGTVYELDAFYMDYKLGARWG
jgi:hypothetical protein